MKSLEMISAERKRQIEEEGWDADHDDRHTNGELVRAAICYAANSLDVEVREVHSDQRFSNEGLYPWKSEWEEEDIKDKIGRHGDIRSLEIAGALIAAEIDRLLRAREGSSGSTLGDLKPGTLFERDEDGEVFVKTAKLYDDGQTECVNLADGMISFLDADTRVIYTPVKI